MRRETRALITERYTGWVEAWGLSLAFAVTQSVEKAERLVADAVVALIAAATEDEITRNVDARVASRDTAYRRDRTAEFAETPSPIAPVKAVKPGELLIGVSAQRFAAVLWETADLQAFRGFGADPFFRMPAVARAIVILKVRGQFSRNQIAGIVRLKPEQVDGHLENSRLLFSEGRPWIAGSPGLVFENGGSSWEPECPRWKSMVPHKAASLDGAAGGAGPTLSETFARYVGNDLDTETGTTLHSHLLVCEGCRTSFSEFKRQYGDWTATLPSLEAAADWRKQLTKVTKMALGARRPTVGDAPRALPGLKKLARDSTLQAMILGGALVIFGQAFLHRHAAFFQSLQHITKHLPR